MILKRFSSIPDQARYYKVSLYSFSFTKIVQLLTLLNVHQFQIQQQPNHAQFDSYCTRG